MKPYRVIGIESSPYAVKVRAVMRYRRLDHIWVARMPQFFEETAQVRPLLMPVVQFPDGDYRTDSTPMIRAMEAAQPESRSVIPADPALAFLSDLIEDMADEWLTKSLFHYRFSNVSDRYRAAAWVIDDAFEGLDDEALETRTVDFIERQVSRMGLVGCTPENGPFFEQSYRRVLDALGSFVATDRFLFGTRPSLADFGLYGQLATLASDHTASGIMRDCAPRVRHWVDRIADASGVEGDWADIGTLPGAVEALLGLTGEYYLPYLDANARAIDAGQNGFELSFGERVYRQPVFRYQAKCYGYLRHTFAALPEVSRERVAGLLDRTGCLDYLEA